jgi:hypothetical protein
MPLCKTVLIYVVLSEEPVEGNGLDFSSIAQKIETGEYISKLRSVHAFELSGGRMVSELVNAGAEPCAFGLDSAGNKVTEVP